MLQHSAIQLRARGWDDLQCECCKASTFLIATTSAFCHAMGEWPAYYPPPDLLSGNASAQPDACNAYHQGHGQWHAQYAHGTGHVMSRSYAPESGSAPWMQPEQTQQPKFQVDALGAPNGCQVHSHFAAWGAYTEFDVSHARYSRGIDSFRCVLGFRLLLGGHVHGTKSHLPLV